MTDHRRRRGAGDDAFSTKKEGDFARSHPSRNHSSQIHQFRQTESKQTGKCEHRHFDSPFQYRTQTVPNIDNLGGPKVLVKFAFFVCVLTYALQVQTLLKH